MGEVAGFELHLYCDHPDCQGPGKVEPTVFTGWTYMQARRAARVAGWRWLRGGGRLGNKRTYCPKHRKETC